jgi:pimeloyl-ACP methyl ester carboxylesterase
VTEGTTVAIDEGFATADVTGPEGAPSLVLLPALGLPAGVLDPVVAHLSRRLRTVVVELPGAGRASPAPPGVTTRALAASLAQVIARLDIGRPHLFGISLSGMVAQWAAIDSPDAIDRLVLASTAARGLEAMSSQPLQKLALARCLLTPGPTRLALAEAMVSDEVREDPCEIQRLTTEIEATPRRDAELAWLVAAALRHDVRERLGQIVAPTLVLTGERDQIIQRSLQEELARGIPGARHSMIAGAGHALAIDQPEETARIIEAFLLEDRA